VDDLVALVTFSFVSTVTPGPNNVLVWASGARFGFRRTIPHLFGTALGIGLMVLAVAAGIGALVTNIPELAFAMRLAGTIYLLYLAWQIAGAHALERGDVAHPLTLLQAALFQPMNPKAWFFTIGAVTTFRPDDLSMIAGSLLVAGVMVVIIVPSQAVWAIGGDLVGRWLTSPRAHRILSLVLAVLLLLTIVLVWI
jgi:threonine/homoserine/homoserine lactone efflux protein